MKNLPVLILMLTVFGQGSAWSQACIPNNDTVAGIEPDTLAVASANLPYEEVIYFHLPGDTVVDFVIGGDTFEVHLCIDSLTIDSVHGLPDGFSFACSVPWCSVLGNGNGCAAISGTADGSQVGIYPLEVFVTIYVNDCYGLSLPPQVDTVSFYYLDVQPATGISEWSIQHAAVTCYPNPSSGKTEISFQASQKGSMHISILNVDGRVVSERKTQVARGVHTEVINVTSLPPSLYLIWISGLNHRYFAKLQVIK